MSTTSTEGHLLLITLEFPLQHLAVVIHRRNITLQIRLVTRVGIGEVRVSRAVGQRLCVCCGVHCEMCGLDMM